MAKLIVIQAGREKSLDFIDDFVFVGSADDCAIRVQGPGVGAKHCQILRSSGAYRVVDLGFPAGTHVNHEKVSQRDLHNGDSIRIGDTTILFKGGATAEPMAAAAPAVARTPAEAAAQKMAANPPPPRRPAGRAGAQRPEPKEIKVAPQLQKAARERQVMTRQNVRKGGLTGPQAFAVIAGVVLLIVIVGIALMKSMGNSGFDQQQWELADKLMAQGRRSDAIAELKKIGEDSPNYRMVQNKLAELEAMSEVAQDMNYQKNGVRAWDSLNQLVMQRLEPNSGMFASKYKDDRPAQARYIVHRCEEFLQKYAKHEKVEGVKQLMAKYKPEAPTTPMSFHEIYVQSDSDRARREFSKAWTALKDWESANPGQSTADVQRLLEDIHNSARDYWKEENDYAKKQIEKNNLGQALSYFDRASKRLVALSDLHAQAKQASDDLVRLAKQMNIELVTADLSE